MAIKYPKIGVNVVLFRDDEILLGRRRRCGKHGMWCPPGGHLHWNEGIVACARRETKEETGITIKNIRIGPYTNDCNLPDGRHYISLFVIADYKSGRLKNGEPSDILEWQWFDCKQLPKPLFYNIRNLLRGFNLAQLRSYVAQVAGS